MKVKKIIAAITALTMLSMTGCADKTSETNQMEITTEIIAETTTAPAVITETVSETTTVTSTTTESVVETQIAFKPLLIDTENEKLIDYDVSISGDKEVNQVYSLISIFNYYGLNPKRSVMTSYVTTSLSEEKISPNENFIDGYGAFASPVIEIANKYITDEKANYISPVDLTGSAPETLYAYIDKAIPVMVWNTNLLRDKTVDFSYVTADNENVELFFWETYILIGYNENEIMLFPISYHSILEDKTYLTFSKSDWEKNFEEVGSYALVLEKTNLDNQ